MNYRSYNKHEGPMVVSKIRESKQNLTHQHACVAKIDEGNIASETASYELSKLIAMSRKSYREGSFIKKCLAKIAKLFKDISLT